MAKLNGPFDFTGRLGDVVAYKLPGSDTTHLRTVGSVSNAKRKRLPSFDIVNRNCQEFGGRSTAGSWIRQAMKGQTALRTYSFVSRINGYLKPLQEMDTVHPLGQRSVLFSASPQLLNNYDLMQAKRFDAVIRNPVDFNIVKKLLSATVRVPALLPGINFLPPEGNGLFQVVASLGLLPDLHYNGDKYAPLNDFDKNSLPVAAETAWRRVATGTAAASLQLVIPAAVPSIPFVLLLSVGIRFGNMVAPDNIIASKTMGAAKILSAV